jgi:hypothetical protein
MRESFARTPDFLRSRIGISQLTNCRRGASRTGSGFSMSTSLRDSQMNKQHLVTRFAPGMPLSRDLLAQESITFWIVKRNGSPQILELKISKFQCYFSGNKSWDYRRMREICTKKVTMIIV